MTKRAIFLWVLVAGAAAIVGLIAWPQTPTVAPIKAPADLPLGVGQTGQVEGLQVTFNKFVQESRCPIDVQCIEGGAVNINVTLRETGHMETRNMPSDEAPYVFGDYRISIKEVAPPLYSGREIPPNAYIITFHVEK